MIRDSQSWAALISSSCCLQEDWHPEPRAKGWGWKKSRETWDSQRDLVIWPGNQSRANSLLTQTHRGWGSGSGALECQLAFRNRARMPSKALKLGSWTRRFREGRSGSQRSCTKQYKQAEAKLLLLLFPNESCTWWYFLQVQLAQYWDLVVSSLGLCS